MIQTAKSSRERKEGRGVLPAHCARAELTRGEEEVQVVGAHKVLRGEAHFHFAVCLPAMHLSNSREFANFQQILIGLNSFHKISAIPAKFRESVGEKHAI